jgi:hypothetical protein
MTVEGERRKSANTYDARRPGPQRDVTEKALTRWTRVDLRNISAASSWTGNHRVRSGPHPHRLPSAHTGTTLPGSIEIVRTELENCRGRAKSPGSSESEGSFMGSDGSAWGTPSEIGWGTADIEAAELPLDPIDRFVISNYAPPHILAPNPPSRMRFEMSNFRCAAN